MYDAKGQDVALTYYFQKAATDTWNVYVTANGTPIAADGAGNPAPSTTINFPANGGTPTAPVGTGDAEHPGLDQRHRRADAGRSPACSSTCRAPRSTARTSA